MGLEPVTEMTGNHEQPLEEQAAPDDLSLEDFLKDLGEEYEQAQKELNEINMLVEQSSTEIEKLIQRNTTIANKMRQVEMHFETAPREDIKQAYTAYHEAQMRLFMMRGQLEQLQHKQQSLERYIRRLLSRSFRLRKTNVNTWLGRCTTGRPNHYPISSCRLKYVNASSIKPPLKSGPN